MQAGGGGDGLGVVEAAVVAAREHGGRDADLALLVVGEPDEGLAGDREEGADAARGEEGCAPAVDGAVVGRAARAALRGDQAPDRVAVAHHGGDHGRAERRERQQRAQASPAAARGPVGAEVGGAVAVGRDDAGDRARVAQRQREGDGGTERVAHDDRPGQVQRGQDARELVGVSGQRVGALVGGEAVTADVVGVDVTGVRQARREAGEHVGRLREPRDEHQRRLPRGVHRGPALDVRGHAGRVDGEAGGGRRHVDRREVVPRQVEPGEGQDDDDDRHQHDPGAAQSAQHPRPYAHLPPPHRTSLPGGP